jgi:hypothetical protein
MFYLLNFTPSSYTCSYLVKLSVCMVYNSIPQNGFITFFVKMVNAIVINKFNSVIIIYKRLKCSFNPSILTDSEF